MKLKLLCFLLVSFISFSQEKEDLFNLIEEDNKQIELLPETAAPFGLVPPAPPPPTVIG